VAPVVAPQPVAPVVAPPPPIPAHLNGLTDAYVTEEEKMLATKMLAMNKKTIKRPIAWMKKQMANHQI